MSWILAIVALIIALNTQSALKIAQQEIQQLKAMLNTHGSPTQPQAPPQQTSQEFASTNVSVSQTQHVYAPQTQFKNPQSNSTNSTTRTSPKKDIEGLVGKTVVGILATLLILVGVVAFGTLIFASFTNIAKAACMMIASILVTIVGLFIGRKNPSTISNLISGCGFGMIFVTIFTSHLYFEIFGDIATYVLVLFWTAAVCFASHTLNLKGLPYVAFIGCIISDIFAISYSIFVDRILEVTIYQLITFALLLMANKDHKILFKISSYTSLGMNCILSIIIISTYEFNPSGKLGLCFILFLCNTLIHVLYTKRDTTILDADVIFEHLTYFIGIIFTCIIPLNQLISDVWFPDNSDQMTLIASIVLLVSTYTIIGLITTLYTWINKQWSHIALLIGHISLTAFICFMPIEYGYNEILLFAPILLSLLHFFHKIKHPGFFTLGITVIALDALSSLWTLNDYPVYLCLHSLFLLTMLTLFMYNKHGKPLHCPGVQFAFINTHLLISTSQLFNYYEWSEATWLLMFAIINAIFIICLQIAQNTRQSGFIEVASSVFLGIILLNVGNYPLRVDSFLLISLLIPLSLLNLPSILRRKDKVLSIWMCIKFTLCSMSTVNLFTGWLDQQFIFSVFLLLIAMLCIVFGFMKNVKPIRVYGLALTMMSVFKMVIMDVWNQTSIIRVVALMAGGVICFAISAIYSKVEKNAQWVSLDE